MVISPATEPRGHAHMQETTPEAVEESQAEVPGPEDDNSEAGNGEETAGNGEADGGGSEQPES